jgi:hypothetical protein
LTDLLRDGIPISFWFASSHRRGKRGKQDR